MKVYGSGDIRSSFHAGKDREQPVLPISLGGVHATFVLSVLGRKSGVEYKVPIEGTASLSDIFERNAV
jgi:hypothetical protein